MPIYEFHCPSCNRDYEERVERMGQSAPCPSCGSTQVERLLSASAVHTKSSANLPSPCAGGQCGFSPSSAPPCCGGGMCGLN